MHTRGPSSNQLCGAERPDGFAVISNRNENDENSQSRIAGSTQVAALSREQFLC